MSIKVFINGLGRIGRNLFRQILSQKEKILITGLNDPAISIDNFIYLINHDSQLGKSKLGLKKQHKKIIAKGQKINFFEHKDINKLKLDCDIFIDCSGLGVSKHVKILNKIKKKRLVLVTNDSNNFKPLIYDLNFDSNENYKRGIYTTSICDSVAAAPIINFLEREYGVENGFITTLHPFLSYQNLLDNSAKRDFPDSFILGRSSINNLIPKSTSVVNSLSKIFKNIKNKFNCISIRVPTTIVSCGLMNINFKRKIILDDLRNKLIKFSKSKKNFVDVTDQPLVSLDFLGEKNNATISLNLLKKTGDKNVNLVYWYDNETGYCSNIIKIINNIEI